MLHAEALPIAGGDSKGTAQLKEVVAYMAKEEVAAGDAQRWRDNMLAGARLIPLYQDMAGELASLKQRALDMRDKGKSLAEKIRGVEAQQTALSHQLKNHKTGVPDMAMQNLKQAWNELNQVLAGMIDAQLLPVDHVESGATQTLRESLAAVKRKLKVGGEDRLYRESALAHDLGRALACSEKIDRHAQTIEVALDKFAQGQGSIQPGGLREAIKALKSARDQRETLTQFAKGQRHRFNTSHAVEQMIKAQADLSRLVGPLNEAG